MDPETLDTIGLHDFDGQLPSCTFTAHPKIDPITGEFACFGYEAKGDGTPDVCYFTFNSAGKLLENVWIVAPVCGMIHDFAVTKNWVSHMPSGSLLNMPLSFHHTNVKSYIGLIPYDPPDL